MPETTPEEQEEALAEAAEVIKSAEAQWRTERRRRAGTIIKPPSVVYCMAIYEERMEQVCTCLKTVRPYVDRCIIVVDESVTPESNVTLSKWGCKIVFRHWNDHFSKQRNMYLDHLREGEWALVSDPDELFNESLMQDLKKIILAAEQEGFNSLSINAHDITRQLDGQITSTTSDWYKQLCFKYEEGVRYVGCVHETLLPGIHGWHSTNLRPQYYYEHFKNMIEVKERGARNIFCGGGGNNVKNINPMYNELHMVANRLAIFNWPQMRAYVREGKLDPELKEIIVKHRNDSGWDWENESRDWFLWCKAILPQEFAGWESNPQPPSAGSPPEVMAYVEEQYVKILGRNADTPGKQAYAEAIVSGRLRREDLPNILYKSDENKRRMNIKVDVIIPANNEENRIKECILQFKNTDIDSIIVVEDRSTDKTEEIAREYADTLSIFPEKLSRVHQSELYNYGIGFSKADWILITDVDEQWPQELLKRLKAIILQNSSETVLAFSFPRDNYTVRGESKDTYPDRQVRLCRRAAVEYKGEPHPTAYSIERNEPVDQFAVISLDSYPILHLPRNLTVKRSWW